ncbi:MAG: energy transducer TonB [Terriglobales bacterium]
MKKLPRRPCVTAACLALFLAVIVFSAPFSSAQEQPDGKRKIVGKVAPIYPELARKLQIHGTVRVEVAVLANGKLRLAEVIGGNPVLAKAAVEAIQQWKWEPAPQETKELGELNFYSR